MRGDGAFGGLGIECLELAEGAQRIDATENELRIRERGAGVAMAVAGWPRHRACAFRPDLEQPAAIDAGKRAAACPDGRDLDHGGANDNAEIDGRLRRDSCFPVGDDGNIEGGTAEIAGDDVRETGGFRDGRRRDHSCRRSGERGAYGKPPRARRGHHAAVRLHDMQPAAEALCRYSVS